MSNEAYIECPECGATIHIVLIHAPVVQPLTAKQKQLIIRLSAELGISPPSDLDTMTKAEASRAITSLIALKRERRRKK